jgi:molybdopterin/thiamine biosynthesis adenylyltransferase
VERWFERYPERLEYELQALRDGGFTAEVDVEARKSGRIVLTVKCTIKSVDHTLKVYFPSSYPHFPFQVLAPSLSLARHQDPYSKALCFIARIETEWRADDTVAKYLLEKLPDILKANESSGPFEGERHEGAPVTPYLPFERESVVLISDWVLPTEAIRGDLQLVVERTDHTHATLRGAVKRLSDQRGNVLGEVDARICRSFPRPTPGRWVRLPTIPKSNNPLELLTEAQQAWSALATPRFSDDRDIVGIVFRDEVRYREWQDTWIFLVRQKAGRIRHQGGRGPHQHQMHVTLVRADRAGRTDLQARVPSLASLATRHAAIFGLGALGSIVTWQLARAGLGRLAIVDYDFVNAATTPRWIYGMSAAGRDKTSILFERLQVEYPLVDIEPISARLGNVFPDTTVEITLRRVLDTAHIVIDCTVEKTVHHYLSSVAWERGIPYIWASGTTGAWGGIVGRVRPDRSRGCWKCFCGHLAYNTIVEPNAEDGPDVQLVGCDAPTFRGVGFDMDEIANMCARLSAATLCEQAPGSYGDFSWDVATLNLRKDGQPIAPNWTTYELQRHQNCDAHD